MARTKSCHRYITVLMLAISALAAQQALGSVMYVSKSATYVGSQQCKGCHPEHYEGWRSTLHPYKFQHVTPDAIIGDFEKNNTLDSNSSVSTMTRKGDEFFVTTKGPDGKEHTYKVKYLIGAFWKQQYVTEFENGALHILPVMWLVETQTWADYHGSKKNKPGDGKYWSDDTWIYQNRCTGCHNTGSEINYDPSSNTYRTTWSEKGVGCEACHGPGSEHVSADDRAKSDTIVNPSKIPDARRASMVCGSCHNRGKSTTNKKYDFPVEYKPGSQLNFLFSEEPKLHPDDSAGANRQQYYDWKKSGHSRVGVQCWDCHLVHEQGVANKAQTKLPGNVLCRSCHTVESKGAHGIHSVNNCIGCHMPATGKRAVKGDVHSHHFNVISPSKTIETGGPVKQPNSCNLCHYHKGDKPEDMLMILRKAKESGRSRTEYY